MCESQKKGGAACANAWRSAEQRVARLILTLMDRLEKWGMVRDQAFNFPRRQTHVADALGLTTPYVNQVCSTRFARNA